jgi:UDP-N-acetylmuramoyl-tripeptide--D-alanyl-D-alanine ligase
MAIMKKTARETADRTSIQTLLEIHRTSKGASIDSREKQKGKVFFALPGTNVDGNDFAIAAIEAGAIAAVIDNPEVLKKAEEIDNDMEKSAAIASKLFLVKNVLQTLQQMGREHRAKFDIPIIAITGSNGKTTTKELLTVSLAKRFGPIGSAVVANVGNLNNHIGVPLTLLRLSDKDSKKTKKTKIAVIEMGANKMGDIRELCTIANPTHCLITNIGIAHIEGFGSKENVVVAKSELYEHVNEHGGIIFINEKDPVLTKALKNIKSRFKLKSRDAQVITYGTKNLISEKNRNKRLIGAYNVINMNAAKAMALHFKVPARSIDQAISEYVPQNMRSQSIFSKKTGNTILLDAYNANPSSMKVAIEAFLETKLAKHSKPGKSGKPEKAAGTGKKILILGDMRELGKESDIEHEKLIKYVMALAKRLNLKNEVEAIFVGEELFKANKRMGKTKSAAANAASADFFKTKEEFVMSNRLREITHAHIFIKGSRGMKLETLVELL